MFFEFSGPHPFNDQGKGSLAGIGGGFHPEGKESNAVGFWRFVLSGMCRNTFPNEKPKKQEKEKNG